MMRRYELNRSSFEVARKIRETFQDAPAKKVDEFSWSWPTTMIEIGSCEAVLYTSDKWKRPGDFTDYKHNAEGAQTLLVRPGFLRDFDRPSRAVDGLVSRKVAIDGPMPDSFAVLAPILGLQARFYVEGEDGEPELPKDYETAYQIDIAKAWLGGAEHPETGQKFLLVYTPSDLCCIITGEILDIEKDGIVG
jgi:hypothetical protein